VSIKIENRDDEYIFILA